MSAARYAPITRQHIAKANAGSGLPATATTSLTIRRATQPERVTQTQRNSSAVSLWACLPICRSMIGQSLTMSTADVLRAFVRGEESTDALRAMGFTIEGSPGNLTVDYPHPADDATVSVSLSDLARGLVVAWARGHGLQEWASLVVMVDWIEVEGTDSGDGQVLWEAVWSSAGGDGVSDRALEVARHLAN